MIRRPPRSTLDRSSAASDVYKRQVDYVILLPLDTKTFYVIPKSLLLANKELFFKSEEGKYSFHLVFSEEMITGLQNKGYICLLYTSPSPRDRTRSRMPSSA